MKSLAPWFLFRPIPLIFLCSIALAAAVEGQDLVRNPETNQTVSMAETSVDPETTTDRIVVTGTAEDGYAALTAVTATKTDTPILETPQSIQVISGQLIRDQRATTLQEALNNVSGVTKSGSPSFDNYNIRGFSAFSTEYLDGLRVEQGNAWFAQEPLMMERIEVLKGPSSTLYGQGSLAGIVNLISKRPTADRIFNVDFTTGSFGFYEGSADVGGPLNQSGSVRYRLTGFYRTNDAYTQNVGRERYEIAPALAWDIDRKTTITFLGNYTHDFLNEFDGIPAEGLFLRNPNGKYPRDFYPGEPGYEDRFPQWRAQLSYALEHRFNDDWKLRQNLRGSLTDGDDAGIWVADLQGDKRTIDRQFSPHFYHKDESLTADTNVEGHFNIFGAANTLLFGVDLIAQHVSRHYFGGDIAPLDIFDPHYGARGMNIVDYGKDQIGNFLIGGYIQDQIKFFDRLSILLAGRYSSSDTSSLSGFDGSTQGLREQAFTPRVGVVYEFVKGASIYGSYGESFEPQIGQDFARKAFDPETGQQWEAGLKTALFDGRLVSTLAVYQLTRQNVLTTDPAHPQFSIETGEERSRGVEYDLAWEIRKGWNLTAAYAYTDSKVTKDNDLPVGTRVDNVARNQFSLWASYEVPKGTFRGLGGGAGVRYVNGREGDMPNTFALPDYTTVDAALWFRRERYRVQLNFYNLGDVVYYQSSYGGRDYILPGDPFAVRASLGCSF